MYVVIGIKIPDLVFNALFQVKQWVTLVRPCLAYNTLDNRFSKYHECETRYTLVHKCA